MTHRPAAARMRQDRPRPAQLALVVVLLLLLASTAGCSSAPAASVVPPTPPTPPRSGATTASAPATSAPATDGQRTLPRDPVVVDWGVDGRLLSIVVRNADDRQVLRGRVQIALHDRSGRLLLATTGPADSKCCTLLSVPPGHRFGLYLSVPHGLGEVGSVTVGFAQPAKVQLRRWPAHRLPRIAIGRPTFTRTSTDAQVTVTLTPRSDVPAYLAGQAFLLDRHHDLVAVISGRFYCFNDDDAHRVTMGLQHPVPAGTRLGEVVAYPIPGDVPPHVPYHCRTSTETP